MDPGTVLRRSIVAWGLGHALLGAHRTAAALLAAELLAVAVVGALTATFVDTTWYLVPFVAGCAFLVAWTGQAVIAYHAARRTQGAIAPAPRGSSATSAAWLSVPLLAWGTIFWLVAATAATPAAVLDQFVTAWPEGDASAWSTIADDPAGLQRASRRVIDELATRCAAGELTSDCGAAPANLLRNVRFRIVSDDGVRSMAVAELVRYEPRPAQFFGLGVGSELVPVAVAKLLTFELGTRPVPILGADVGARRWTIMNAGAS